MTAEAHPPNPEPQYFGVDRHAADLSLQIEAAIQAHAPIAGTGMHHIHALIDGATDQAFGDELMARSLEPRSAVRAVYNETPLDAAQSCGIFLWSCGRDELPALLSRCSGLPMLSLLQTPLDIDLMRLHLASFARGQTPDGLRLVLRIADPIRLHDLLVALGEHMQSRLRSGFAAWHLIGRDGNLLTWTGTAALDQQPHERTTPWPVSDQAFVKLMASCEADEVLCSVARRDDSMCMSGRSSELHQRARALLDVLDARRLANPNQRQELVMKALAQRDTPAAVHWLREQMNKDFR